MTKSSSSKDEGRPHLLFLDGLRGLAALYVVLVHAYLFVGSQKFLPAALHPFTNWLAYGQVAVDVFIVLSGYCLMLPVAKNGVLRGGIQQFYLRRARRILPPYYAALILCLLVIAFVPAMRYKTGSVWDMALPGLTPASVVSHILLLHNLTPSLLHQIDPPMWSVATEFQIYLLFPIVLLPVWRKFGNVAAVVVSFVLGLTPLLLFNRGGGSCPWFLGLFALGMAAANYSFSPKSTRKFSPRTFLFATLILGAIFWIATLTVAPWLLNHLYAMDTLVGVITACLLTYCSEHTLASPKNPTLLLKCLNSRFAVILGTFSYSLYLVHYPILAACFLVLRSFGLSLPAIFFGLISVGTLVCLGLAYAFHLAFERRFMPNLPKTTRQTIEATLVSPAP